MPQGRPRSGEFYKHFKKKLYQVLAVAQHSETGEELVVYQALYGDYRVYARPLAMFTSEVDRNAYPDAEQEYRFQLVDPCAAGDFPGSQKEDGAESGDFPGRLEEDGVHTGEAGKSAAGDFSGGQKEVGAKGGDFPATEKKEISELLMDFYDAETCEEKYEILTAMQKDITDVMIDNMAVVLDVVIPEGDLYQRYDELRTCLKTRQRYEIRR